MLMILKKARPEDIETILEAETACFPEAEAASRERLEARLAAYPDCFWVGKDEFGTTLCYAAGPYTKASDLTDEMYADPSCYDPDGDWLMLFSVCTMPQFRRQGIAAWLLNRVLAEAEEADKKGVVLTCKEDLIPYYEKFGFVNEGESGSVHGGARWYQMRVTFDEDYKLEHLFWMSEDPDENQRLIEEALFGRAF